MTDTRPTLREELLAEVRRQERMARYVAKLEQAFAEARHACKHALAANVIGHGAPCSCDACRLLRLVVGETE